MFSQDYAVESGEAGPLCESESCQRGFRIQGHSLQRVPSTSYRAVGMCADKKLMVFNFSPLNINVAQLLYVANMWN